MARCGGMPRVARPGLPREGTHVVQRARCSPERQSRIGVQGVGRPRPFRRTRRVRGPRRRCRRHRNHRGYSRLLDPARPRAVPMPRRAMCRLWSGGKREWKGGASDPVWRLEAAPAGETSGTDASMGVAGGGANASSPSPSFGGTPTALLSAAVPTKRFNLAQPTEDKPRKKGNMEVEKPGLFDASVPPSPVTRLRREPGVGTDHTPRVIGAIGRSSVCLGTMWCSE